MNDSMLELIAQTQSNMASTMADMGKSLSNMEVNQGRLDERMITIFENYQKMDVKITGLSSRTRSLENLTSVNKFARQFAPRMFFSLIAAFGVGGSLVYAALEIVKNG